MIPCFAAEKPLGKLAKWLRLLGFDTIYASEVSGEAFIELLKKPRILLTRTQRVQEQNASHPLIFIKSDHLNEQLKQVLQEVGLTRAHIRPFSRCLQCNVPIVATEKDSLWGRVPDYIYETQGHFHVCPECQRIYWPGSHTKRSMQKINQLFDWR
jgi:uncharacterized protein with PIN domain